MKTARDLILELYKEDHITKQEADTLLDAIDNKNNYYTQPTYQPYVDWTYRPYEALLPPTKLDNNKQYRYK